MRRQTPIAHLLYNHLYPNPQPNDPPSFSAHLARNLVPEVRIEVATFYGDLNTTEARYPGLNYCYPPHRMRLGRFKHHRRLFEAFDTLSLTYNEIQDFCCWEGTRWARERYEKDEDVKVEDTTGLEIQPWVDMGSSRGWPASRRQTITRKTDISVVVEDTATVPSSSSRQPHAQQLQPQQLNVEEQEVPADEEMTEEDNEDDEDDESPEEAAAHQQHIDELNLRRDASIHQRIMQYWEQGASLPPDLEQYLKEQSEAGNLTGLDLQTFFTSRRASNRSVPATFPAATARRANAVGSRAAA